MAREGTGAHQGWPMTAVAEERDRFRSLYDSSAGGRRGEPAWLMALREEAMDRFSRRGFPTTREEAWRHTNVSSIARTDYGTGDPDARISAETLARAPLMGAQGATAVFVNGRYSREMSSPGANPGVVILALRDALRQRGDLATRFGRLVSETAEPFSDLNAALLDDGAIVFLTTGAVVKEAIQIVHVSANPDGGATASYPRTLVVAGQGSDARIVETFAGADCETYLANAVTEVFVEEDATLSHYRLQREGDQASHLGLLAVRQAARSRYTNHHLALGAALSRLDLGVRLEGEGAECSLFGLFMADGECLTDASTVIHHALPHCRSREIYKGILSGKARGVFGGLIRVRPGANGTDASQTNRNLLLSEEAMVHSNPQLEILADDVRCKHGSTTGRLDPVALFYLRSRGIGEEAARALLTWAFASEVVQTIGDAGVRAIVQQQLLARLVGLGDVQEAVA